VAALIVSGVLLLGATAPAYAAIASVELYQDPPGTPLEESCPTCEELSLRNDVATVEAEALRTSGTSPDYPSRRTTNGEMRGQG
jgi:hypothetical protein